MTVRSAPMPAPVIAREIVKFVRSLAGVRRGVTSAFIPAAQVTNTTWHG
jgi:hypothetical protein